MTTLNKNFKKKFLITGGAGFIGSSLIRLLINETENEVLNFDKLTYASNLKSLEIVSQNSRYQFVQGDICDKEIVTNLFIDFQPDIVMHLAAESHVDRSIDKPEEFIKTNVMGTLNMLECALKYWNNTNQKQFLFHHISTDEVYGSLNKTNLFTEQSRYDPSSPYSASKASSDHLVNAWHKTYGLPVIVTNCSNNYGPYQFPEKLIPLIILNALEKKPLPIYGRGENIRDWLYVEDHVKALYKVVTEGRTGQVYNIGGHNEKSNIEVVRTICVILDDLMPININNNTKHHSGNIRTNKKSYKDLIIFVEDRPGHDFRYAIDASKIQKELNWFPKQTFEIGLRKTIKWYLSNLDWCKKIVNETYKRQRLGLIKEKFKREVL